MSVSTSPAAEGVRRVLPALLFFIAVAGLITVLGRAGIHLMEPRGTKDYGAFAVGVAGALLVTRLVEVALFDVGYRLRRSGPAPELLRQLVSLLVFGFLLGMLCKVVLSVSLPALLTTSAIITAVLGLALQETLGNLFSGIGLAMERTVQVGDMVRAGENLGLVEQLSWRAIKVRTMEGNALLIPNIVASRERLEVFRRGGAPMARALRVGLEFQASPARVRSCLEAAARDVTGVVAHPTPVARVQAIQDFAIVYELAYWLQDFAQYLDIDSRVRERVWYRLEREGMTFAYPVVRQHQYDFGVPPATDANQVLREIEEHELFRPLTDEERRRLAAGARLIRFGEGETVVREGDTTSSMFLIASGRAAVSVHGNVADSRGVAVLEAGSAFGEISLLTGEPRLATVRSLTESSLVEIDKDTLAPILRSNPSLVAKLDRIILERRQHTADRRAEPGASPSVAEAEPLGERIARFFGLKGA